MQPIPNFPRPFPASLSASDEQYAEVSRYLLHHSLSSGYRLRPRERQSVKLQRHSDSRSSRQAHRSLQEEMVAAQHSTAALTPSPPPLSCCLTFLSPASACPLPQPCPSPFLFPPELHRDLRLGRDGLSSAVSASRSAAAPFLFVSSAALQSQMDRLTELDAASQAAAGDASSVPVKDERKLESDSAADAAAADRGVSAAEAGGGGGGEEEAADGRVSARGAEDDEEADADELPQSDDSDDMQGGDYTGRYQEDDDGEGDTDVFGEDDGDCM